MAYSKANIDADTLPDQDQIPHVLLFDIQAVSQDKYRNYVFTT
jgi:hypothetical protein